MFYKNIARPTSQAPGPVTSVKAFNKVTGFTPTGTCDGGDFTKSTLTFTADANPCDASFYTGLEASKYSDSVIVSESLFTSKPFTDFEKASKDMDDFVV